jgi:hypothetical protein
MGGRGTMPVPYTPEWENFIVAAAVTILSSKGVWGWEILNEQNNPREWPAGASLTPADIITTYNAIRNHVYSTASIRLSPGALDPFNAQAGDPRDWLTRTYNGITGAEFVCAHGYIRGPDATLVNSEAKFTDYPLTWQYLNYYRCVTELLSYLPSPYSELPVFVTETNHLWKTVEGDWGWVEDTRSYNVVKAIHEAAKRARIDSVALYRWSGDAWRVSTNSYVLNAVKDINNNYG